MRLTQLGRVSQWPCSTGRATEMRLRYTASRWVNLELVARAGKVAAPATPSADSAPLRRRCGQVQHWNRTSSTGDRSVSDAVLVAGRVRSIHRRAGGVLLRLVSLIRSVVQDEAVPVATGREASLKAASHIGSDSCAAAVCEVQAGRGSAGVSPWQSGRGPSTDWHLFSAACTK